MSFLFDKKTEHEAACEAAIWTGDGAKAVFHATKAAEFCFALAKQVTGPVSASFVTTGEGWLEIAEKLKASKLRKAPALPGTESGGASGGAGEVSEGDSEFQVSEDTGVSFDDIDGMEEAKASIHDIVINPMHHPEKAKAFHIKPGGGVLLYGPPGNGKTMFGKAIAHEIHAPFFYASGAQLRSKWHGESEQKLSALLHAAQEKPVAVLFLDEIDGLLPRRTENSSAVDNRLVTQFLSDVGGFKDSPNTLLILGATNKPWEIDEAVFRTGRFDEKIYIGLPDAEARLGMLERAFRDVELEEGVDLGALAGELEGYSGSDIAGIAKKACQIAFRRSLGEEGLSKVSGEDFAQAKAAIPSSITEAMLRQYDEFNTSRFH